MGWSDKGSKYGRVTDREEDNLEKERFKGKGRGENWRAATESHD